MKKIILITILLLCLLLSACHSNSDSIIDSSLPDTSDTDLMNDFGSLFGTEGFQEAIVNNPIDEEFYPIQFTGSSVEFIEKTSQYCELWNIEMENAYKTLLGVLNETDKKILIKSQDSWTEYMNGNNAIQKSLFYEHNYDDNAGQDQKMFAIDYQATATRKRAMELFEYLFRISGEIQFVYASN